MTQLQFLKVLIVGVPEPDGKFSCHSPKSYRICSFHNDYVLNIILRLPSSIIVWFALFAGDYSPLVLKAFWDSYKLGSVDVLIGELSRNSLGLTEEN